MLKCYMCDAEGVTQEHAPPYSFHPEGYRTGLWKVPSCEKHNCGNNLDVEYVRNIITTHLGTENSVATHLHAKVLGSFENSPKLFNRTFAEAESVNIAGRETVAYPPDMRRFTAVMESIAHATYYKTQGKTFEGSWGIVSPNLKSRRTLQGLTDRDESVARWCSEKRYTEISTPQPEIFRLGVCIDEQGLIFRFEFYRAFLVYCLG